MKAKEMFEEMGWKLKSNSDYVIIWYFDLSDCDSSTDSYIVFKKNENGMDIFNQYCSLSLDRELPLFESNQKIFNGGFELNPKATTFYLSVEHHQAIAQQMKELGWIE